jgi:hypothetical protein
MRGGVKIGDNSTSLSTMPRISQKIRSPAQEAQTRWMERVGHQRPKHCARVTARDCAARCTNTDKQGSLSTRSTSDRTWFVSCASRRIIGPVANATGPCIRHEPTRGVLSTEPSCKRDGFLDAAPSSFKLNGQNPTPARFCAQSPARLTPPGSWSSHMSALEGGVSQKTK